jgi:hypothetical protein
VTEESARMGKGEIALGAIPLWGRTTRSVVTFLCSLGRFFHIDYSIRRHIPHWLHDS